MSKSKQVNNYETEEAHLKKKFFSTNNVLICQDKKGTTVYLPGYLRIKFKNFLDMDLNNLTSLINATIIFNIYYGDLFQYDQNFHKPSHHWKSVQDIDKDGHSYTRYVEQTYKEELIEMFETELKLNFSRDSAILLAEKTNDEENLQIDVKHASKEQQVKFTVRKSFHVHLDGDLRWSPFEVINSILQITVQPITLKVQGTTYNFKVNLMDHPENELKLSFGEEKTFGHYGLAVKLARTRYTNVKVQKSEELYMQLAERKKFLKEKNPENFIESLNIKQVDIKYYQYAYFNIPMYKFPSSSLVTVFIPLWLLGLINLGIYFQDQSLSDRIGSIIALMLAFIAYIPTIEAAIPPSSNIVFMQGLVYMQSFASLMTFIHSMRIRNLQNFRLVWYETPEYWITLVVTAGSFILVMILMAVHYTCWVRGKYNEGQDDKLLGKKGVKRLKLKQFSVDEAVAHKSFESPNPSVKDGKKKMFDRKTWSNTDCDLYFNMYYNYNRQRCAEKNDNDQKFMKQSKEGKENKQGKKKKQFRDYFIITLRGQAFTDIQKLIKKGQEKEQSETEIMFDAANR